MRALAANGRRADALTVYQRLKRRLVEDLGLDPVAEIQALHHAVLQGA
jgi:DNA-binding SARP family transcriptional activator